MKPSKKTAAKAVAKAAAKDWGDKKKGSSPPVSNKKGAKDAPQKPLKGKDSGKVVAKDTKPKKKKRQKSDYAPLFHTTSHNYGVGNDLPPKQRDLRRYVRWPKYIQLQRHKRVLLKRLRVPPSINQFRYTVDRHLKKEIFRLALRYRPESKMQMRKRLKEEALRKLKNPKAPPSFPGYRLYRGAQRVTRLIEKKQAKLVLIAHDVDPIEIVLFMPSLCKKLGVPWCIIRGKANLGQLVGRKTSTCAAFVDIRAKDKPRFEKLCQSIQIAYNDRYDEISKKWGGLQLSKKSRAKALKRKKLAEKK